MQFISQLDVRSAFFAESIRSDFLTLFLKAITYLGEWWFVLGVAAIVTIIFFSKKNRVRAFILWLTVLGTTADTFILKRIIHRQRPFDALFSENTFSFPSAHSALSIALYGFIAYFFWQNAKNKISKILILTTGIIFIALIGFSRLYLGAHYLSDVIGGYILGALWLALGIYILKYRRRTSKLLDVRRRRD